MPRGVLCGRVEASGGVKNLAILFDACFRIQREAGTAAGHHIPLVVENVKGAQPWVGAAKAHYGSFYLWGDVESVGGAIVGTRPRFGEILRAKRAIKNGGGSWFGIGSPGQIETGQNPVNGVKVEGISFNGHGELGHKPQGFNVTAAQRYREENGQKTPPRQAASAQIAKIPEPLARHIARIYRP
jgi:hypothetical protein